MADTPENTHRATQTRHPWRATVRTVAAYIVAGVLFLIPAIPLIQEHLGPWLPDAWQVWLTGATAFLAALAGLVTRLMALPQAQRLLEAIGLGTGDAGH